MDSRPDISILIPCHNEEDGIESTVCNLLKKLAPTGISFEILCVNNTSTDQTERVLQQLAETYEQLWYVNTRLSLDTVSQSVGGWSFSVANR